MRTRESRRILKSIRPPLQRFAINPAAGPPRWGYAVVFVLLPNPRASPWAGIPPATLGLSNKNHVGRDRLTAAATPRASTRTAALAHRRPHASSRRRDVTEPWCRAAVVCAAPQTQDVALGWHTAGPLGLSNENDVGRDRLTAAATPRASTRTAALAYRRSHVPPLTRTAAHTHRRVAVT